jgi:hypothetical protein
VLPKLGVRRVGGLIDYLGQVEDLFEGCMFSVNDSSELSVSVSISTIALIFG